MGEIYRIFGIEDTEKLLQVFAGTTIYVPSTKNLENEERNLAIYETLKKSKSMQETRRLGELLCEQYKLKTREMRLIRRQTEKKLQEAKRFVESDKLVSKHQPKKIKLKQKNKRSL